MLDPRKDIAIQKKIIANGVSKKNLLKLLKFEDEITNTQHTTRVRK